jgi:hypothetical protein
MLDSFARAAALDRCARMALAGIRRESPHWFDVLGGPGQTIRARDLTPVFYGCYDWHSAVHSHWLLVRLLSHQKAGPSESLGFEAQARRALSERFTPDGLAAEWRFLSDPHRVGFERPYGLAWLLELAAELRGWRDRDAAMWSIWLAPLEELAAARFRDWLPNLAAPIRTGEHSQTAFALGLVADWSRVAGDDALRQLVRETALRFYADDADLPLAWEPSGHDFLSPALAEADLLRRFLEPDEYAAWLSRALPGFPDQAEFPPVSLPDDLSDGKLAHFAGLNFSRAWMLEGIAAGLPVTDARRFGLEQLRLDHLRAGLPALDSDEWAVTHWVGSFAVYALTQREAQG